MSRISTVVAAALIAFRPVSPVDSSKFSLSRIVASQCRWAVLVQSRGVLDASSRPGYGNALVPLLSAKTLQRIYYVLLDLLHIGENADANGTKHRPTNTRFARLRGLRPWRPPAASGDCLPLPELLGHARYVAPIMQGHSSEAAPSRVCIGIDGGGVETADTPGGAEEVPVRGTGRTTGPSPCARQGRPR